MMWELYIFPGGLVKTVNSRCKARLWILLNYWRISELCAINQDTGEHIIR